MSDQELKIKLMQLEIDALRSVLSELGYDDLSCYTQWIKAQAIAEVLLCLK